MSTSFSRSIRTMQMETSGRPVAALLVAALFLVGWLAWLVLAQVAVYAVSDTVVLTDSAHATAHFTPDAWQTIQPGQSAWLRFDAFSEPVPATVTEVDQTILDGRFSAQLRLQSPPDSANLLPVGLIGRIEVEVEQVTPFTLLLRSAR